MIVTPRTPGRGTVFARNEPVQVQEWTDRHSWDAFIAGATDGTIAHRWPWLKIVRDTYGHRTFALAAVRGQQVCGVLPLVLVRSLLFSRQLVSMPYLDCGGICSGGDAGAQQALLHTALGMAQDHRTPLELRHRDRRNYDLPASTHKVTMTLDLTGGESMVWSRIKSNRRGQVRKATRNGLTVEVHGEEGVPDFFSVLAANMRDLGSPMHRRTLFASIMENFGEDARILLVRSDAQTVGAGLVLLHHDTMVLPFSSSLRPSFSLGTNQLLYWEAIRYAVARQCRVFDFGRSSPGSGTYEAKREWGAEPVPLYWYHDHASGKTPEPTQRREWAADLWRRLPVPVATAAGHLIRGGLAQ